MSAKIIPFPSKKADQGIVDMLQHILSLAQEGKVKFVAIAWVNDDGVAASSWTPDQFAHQAHLTAALGSVQFLSARFNESVLAGAEPTDDEPDAA